MVDAFYFADGSSASSPRELLVLLEKKDSSLTQEHAARNDYANWVRHCVGNYALADRLERCGSVEEVIKVLRLEQPSSNSVTSTSSRKEIHDLKKPGVSQATPATDTPASSDKPKQEAVPDKKPPAPTPIGHSLFSHDSLRDFLSGFIAGILVSVLLWVIVGAFA